MSYTDEIGSKIEKQLENKVIEKLKENNEDTHCFQTQIIEEHGNLRCYVESNSGDFYYYTIKETDASIELIEL